MSTEVILIMRLLINIFIYVIRDIEIVLKCIEFFCTGDYGNIAESYR